MRNIIALLTATALIAGCSTMKMERKPIMITIKTSMGEIKAELFPDKAPETVKNFLQYVTDKHFDGTVFHRVIPGFMVQGGGFTKSFEQKETRAPVINEATNGLKNTRGTLAMARTAVINSASSQFFVNVADNGFLNHTDTSMQGFGYCVFGKVTQGMDVVDKIVSVKRGNRGPHDDVPLQDIVIESITSQ